MISKVWMKMNSQNNNLARNMLSEEQMIFNQRMYNRHVLRNEYWIMPHIRVYKKTIEPAANQYHIQNA